MRTSIQINIPEPCHENWAKMTPKEKGRHCARCEKTVFNFTNKTDETIVKTFITKGKVCGRFKTSQLNRELILSRKEKNNYLSFVASTLLAFLSISPQDVKAQEQQASSKISSLLQGNINCGITATFNKPKLIEGNVSSALDGLPLPGANIIIKGTSESVKTDFDGNFKIHAKSSDTLIFTFPGMKEKELITSNKETINIKLEEDEFECIDSVVVGYSNVNYYDQCLAKKRRQERKQKRILKRQQIKNKDIVRTDVGKFLYQITNIFRKTK